MNREIPLPLQSLHEPTPTEEASLLLAWAGNLIVQLMDEAAPNWFRNGGKDLDIEDVARLSVMNARIKNCLDTLREIETAAPCQSAADEKAEASSRDQLQGYQTPAKSAIFPVAPEYPPPI